jgi:glutamate carboxypeptidase
VVAFLNLEGHEEFFKGKVCLIRKGIAGFRFTVKGIAAHASYCAREGANAIADAAHKILEIDKIKDDAGVTCNCGVITGGTTSNAVPALCEFRVDVRFATQEQYRDTIDRLQKIADTVHVPGCTCEMVQTNLRPAMELNEQNIALLAKANALFEQNGLSTLEVGMRTGGSDAADVACCGIPCLDSIGVGGERSHSAEEYGVIASLAESAKRIASIICGI